jgi:hypothetical protein
VLATEAQRKALVVRSWWDYLYFQTFATDIITYYLMPLIYIESTASYLNP